MMDEFRIAIDQKMTVWERKIYYIKARSLAQAKRIAMSEDPHPLIYENDKVIEGDSETLYDTMESYGDEEIEHSECEKV